MHVFNQYLGTINKGLEFIGITVEDNTNLFQPSGSMDAVLQGGDATTPVLWTQVSGIPVNFTTPLDGLHIEFTTTDLGFKEFQCCVNMGTDFEQCAIGKFFHYPKEEFMSAELIFSADKNTWFPSSSAISINAYPGSYTSQGSNESAVEIKPGIGSDHTEYTLSGIADFDPKSFESIQWQQFLGGAWVDIDDYFYANKSKLYNLAADVNTQLRALVTINFYGIYKQIIISDSRVLNQLINRSGVVSKFTPNNLIFSGVINVTSDQSSLTTRQDDEHFKSGNFIISRASGMQEQHGSLTTRQEDDTFNHNNLIISTMNNMVEVLHSSTGII